MRVVADGDYEVASRVYVRGCLYYDCSARDAEEPMFESRTYPKVAARVSGSEVQKLSKGGHEREFGGAGVARLGWRKRADG